MSTSLRAASPNVGLIGIDLEVRHASAPIG
jgi:hypothetical protein